MISKIARKLSSVVGLDAKIRATLVLKLWRAGSGVATIFLVAEYLTPELQGYYYTFFSLLALQALVEMGLNTAIVQFVTHEVVKLKWVEAKFEGSFEALNRLRSIGRFTRVWYLSAALIFFLLLAPGGYYFLENAGANAVEIRLEWILIVFATSISLFMNGYFVLLEGCDYIAEVAKVRLGQSVCSVVLIWLLLIEGTDLMSIAVGAFAHVLVGLPAITWKYRGILADIMKPADSSLSINWKTEVWPFQWRIAVSWISGFFIFQFFNPLILYFSGPVDAGRYGMSAQIVYSALGLTSAWLTTKAPNMGSLVARREFDLLNKTFWSTVRQSSVLTVVGLFFLAMLVEIGGRLSLPISERLLDPKLFALLAICGLSTHVTFAQSLYLRVHKVEPFVVVSFISACVTAASAIILVPQYGARGAVVAYFLGSVLVAFPLGTYIFIAFRHTQFPR
ncbi:MAG: hypothetical protein V7696_00290 [Halioglobus sp.]